MYKDVGSISFGGGKLNYPDGNNFNKMNDVFECLIHPEKNCNIQSRDPYAIAKLGY